MRILRNMALILSGLIPALGWSQSWFDGQRLKLPIVNVGTDRYNLDLVLIDGDQLIFQLDPSSLTHINATATTHSSDPAFTGTQLIVPEVIVGKSRYSAVLDLVDAATYRFKVNPALLVERDYRGGNRFRKDSRIVSTTFFHWYATGGGQLSGPWTPVEGRENWDGFPPWWQTQIKQVMAANIDVMYVHLINGVEERRVTLFMALNLLLEQGYDIPDVAPFLDPLITWYEQPLLNLATAEGKAEVAAQYVRFYNQYFEHVTHENAAANLATIDGRPVLVSWHSHINLSNLSSFTRNDLMLPLQQAFGAQHALFNQPPWYITTALNPPVFSFTDERLPLFEINEYYFEALHNELRTAQVKPGYWDQNVRNPGSFLPRNGGVHYKQAWDRVHSGVSRVYVESWNEYDEGTGIYAGSVGSPYIKPGSGNSNTDTWSSSGDPFEYIKTTAAGAARFNDRPELDAIMLSHTLPTTMTASGRVSATIRVRNAGDESWSGARGFALMQLFSDGFRFSHSIDIDDNSNEIPIYDGIFRGRPIDFSVELNAPAAPGLYVTRWQMAKNGVPFGGIITRAIRVQ